MAQLLVARAGETQTITFAPPEKIDVLLKRMGVAIKMPCGGRGVCGKCRVRVRGALSEPEAAEREALGETELARGVRLACAARALGDVRIDLAESAGESILTGGVQREFAPDGQHAGLGVALDIGTTTLAAYLYRLNDATRLAVASAGNPQAAYGADVISRIGASMAGAQAELRACIAAKIRELVGQLCREAACALEEIADMTIVGNTAMLYLLTGRDPSSIAQAPFDSETLFGEEITARDFGLNIPARLIRCCSAYVGADITAAMLACGFDALMADKAAAPVLLADIGTNGEMAIVANGRLLCCSTAAGPAFEGAGLHQGMNAGAGAIVHAKEGFRLEWIGERPTGICGSGIVDILAEMLRTGVIDESGQIQSADHDYAAQLHVINDQPAFCIPGTEVCITQKDVRTIQLAKAALCAGMRTLIHRAGLEVGDVHSLLIAGGFGSCIAPESAGAIGLIPPELAPRARAVGNAAGSGAALTLLSQELNRQAETLSRVATTVELSSDPYFMEQYVNAMLFGDEE